MQHYFDKEYGIPLMLSMSMFVQLFCNWFILRVTNQPIDKKMFTLHTYPDFQTLCNTVADKWLAIINNTPVGRPCAFALAGGTTPEPLYRHFDIQFAKAPSHPIQLVATDERWVPDADPQSNEGLFKRCFTHSASHCKLISLKNNQLTPKAAVADISQRLHTELNHPFSAVILGMGADGHVASLFPNAPELLINDPHIDCVAAVHPKTGQTRMSLSLSRLLNSLSIWIVITGAEKRAVLEDALREKTPPFSPIATLLNQAQCDVEVFWCL
jgi:6-phosphogluconolactonase